jgi:hypothetical protein
MIREKKKKEEFVIDLTGPDGNVFVLIATARRLARQIEEMHSEELVEARKLNDTLFETGLDESRPFPERLADLIQQEMMAKDYEWAIARFDHWFGDWVILER